MNLDLANIDLSKDPYTRRFFPKTEHIGPIESLFRLDCPSVRERIFAGRRATMLSGERVLLVQQMKTVSSGPTVDEGAVFVGDDTLLHHFETAPTAPHLVEFWKREVLAPGGYKHGASHTQQWREYELWQALVRAHPLPIYVGRLARCFVPPHWGQGTLVWEGGEGSAVSLVTLHRGQSDRFIQEERRIALGMSHDDADHRAIGALEVRFNISALQGEMARLVVPLDVTFRRQTPTSSLVDRPEHQFLDSYRRIALDRKRPFSHLLQFHALSDEQRCLQVLGCDLATMEKTLKRLLGIFANFVADQGQVTEGEHIERFLWRPLVQSFSLFSRPSPDEGTRPISLPATLKKARQLVCTELGCNLAALDRDEQGPSYQIARVGREWAKQIIFEVKRPTTGHELFMLASKTNDND